MYLDPELSSTPIKYPSLVTHAHSDHTAAVSGGSETYLTETTIKLYDVTSPRRARNYHKVNLYEPFELGPFQIEYLNAGHLLGAAQILVRKGSHTFLYTGDFCPEDLLTIKGADLPQEELDVTVIDATYGDQLIFFDSRSNSRQNLFIWTIQSLGEDKIPIINVGHLGGAQEVIAFYNKLAPNLPILVSDRVKQVCEVYEEMGVDLTYTALNHPDADSLIEDKCIIVVPRNFKKVDGLVRKHPVLKGRLIRAIVTGQTAKYGFRSFNYASALSTHAHYNELIETTKQLNPIHVLTHYGYHKKLAKSLVEDHNISAESFPNSKPLSFQKLNSHDLKAGITKSQSNTTLDQFF